MGRTVDIIHVRKYWEFLRNGEISSGSCVINPVSSSILYARWIINRIKGSLGASGGADGHAKGRSCSLLTFLLASVLLVSSTADVSISTLSSGDIRPEA